MLVFLAAGFIFLFHLNYRSVKQVAMGSIQVKGGFSVCLDNFSSGKPRKKGRKKELDLEVT